MTYRKQPNRVIPPSRDTYPRPVGELVLSLRWTVAELEMSLLGGKDPKPHVRRLDELIDELSERNEFDGFPA